MNKNIQRGLMSLVAVALTASMMYQFIPGLRSQATNNQKEAAIKVNGSSITAEDLTRMRRSNQVLSSIETGVIGDDFKALVVSRSVLQQLYLDDSKNIKVDRADIDNEVKKIREANNLTDNKKWTDALQGAGLSDAAYRKILYDSKAIEKRTDEIKATAKPATDAEAKVYYDFNKENYKNEAKIVGRQIVVANESKAKDLLKEIKGGSDFAKLASENSLENKDRGGALGPIENGSPKAVLAVVMPNEVSTAAFALTGGGVTDVITSGGRFYIVKVEKYLDSTVKAFDEAKSDIIKTIDSQKKDAAMEEWTDKLVNSAKIEYIDTAWKTVNPTVAVVAGAKVPYTELIAQVAGNPQLAQVVQQMPPEQLTKILNESMKVQVLGNIIQAYASPAIAKKLKLDLTGNRYEQLSELMAYGSKDVKVTEEELQKFYQDNIKNFETPGSAVVDEASFSSKEKAEAFAKTWKGEGEFATAATKAGGTVSERGNVTAASGLDVKLAEAVFKAKLTPAGEGSLSSAVAVGQRYSVAYVRELKQSTAQPFSEVRRQIEPQVLSRKKTEASTAFIEKELKALKPENNLKSVLAEQAKRVTAEEKAAAGKAKDTKPKEENKGKSGESSPTETR